MLRLRLGIESEAVLIALIARVLIDPLEAVIVVVVNEGVTRVLKVPKLAERLTEEIVLP